MTTTDAAAAKYVHIRMALAALATLFAASLAGCSTSNLLGTDSTLGPDNGAQAAKPAQQAPVQVARKIAIPDVIGAPEAVNRQLVQKLTSAMQARGLAPAPQTDKPEYTLRGYMVAAKERKGTKISYIWDLTDRAGNKLKRTTGEELAQKTQGTDPWAAVTPALIEKVAAKAVDSVSSAIPSNPVSPGNAVVANAASTAPMPQATGSTTTGSIARPDSLEAIVSPVTGAPGDGNISLARAMKKALAANGVLVDPRNPQAAYRIEGRVKLVGQAEGKNQPVQLLWTVKDAAGRNIGGLQQDNSIDLATLNGSWGTMADDAAAAAAQGIVKLLPNKQVQASR